ncbi:hypothetical protein ACFV4P_18900 [Kitasatospora sp. NPDC059795]|uniref:hypothetical protein n=1 Tax=Kitasatospora sp. NPDC059795 TaxID=3346949 RepID=UPI003661404C
MLNINLVIDLSLARTRSEPDARPADGTALPGLLTPRHPEHDVREEITRGWSTLRL